MAVYTQVSDEDVAAFLDDYDIGNLKAKHPIAEGVENTNYKVETNQGAYILTLFEKRTNEADLPFFMDLMAHLAAKGLPAPAPVQKKSGAVVSPLANRPAVIVTFLLGEPDMTPSAAHCASAGAILADLHHAVPDFKAKRQNALSLAGWRRLADDCRSRADECAAGLSNLIDEELAFLEAQWPRDLPEGVVHADLFPDNVLFTEHEVSGVIDFYFSCNEFFAYDLAVCLNAWCFDQRARFSKDNAAAMMKAYLNKRALSAAEANALPLLLRGSALRFLLTRLYDWLHQVEGAIVKVKDPLEYRGILEHHRQHYQPTHYGLTQ